MKRINEAIAEKANSFIKETGMSPRKLIEKSSVEVICTTDDIIDNLSWHNVHQRKRPFLLHIVHLQTLKFHSSQFQALHIRM